MKKITVVLFSALLILAFSASVYAADDGCTTIQDGTLTYSTGHYLNGTPIPTGFDAYGNNYQARLFSGSYANNYLGRDGFPPYEGDDDAYLTANPGAASTWYWPYRDVDISMKWNDAWISNKDCDLDGSLDRHFGYPTYIGSGAWLTNHQKGLYMDGSKKCKWIYFTKIIAAPSDANVEAGNWITADGTEIGPVIWGSFATIQSVYNDPCGGYNGIEYLSDDHAGFGGW